MNIEELNNIKDSLIKVKQESINYLVTDDLMANIDSLLSKIYKAIQEEQYLSIFTKEERDMMCHNFNKIIVFSNGDLKPEFKEFDFDKLENKVKELNEKNIKDADKIAIFSNSEPKTVGRFKRLI